MSIKWLYCHVMKQTMKQYAKGRTHGSVPERTCSATVVAAGGARECVFASCFICGGYM